MNNVKELVAQVKDAFSKPDIVRLKKLGNHILNLAGFDNNKLLAKISLIAYCLHKLLTKEHIVTNKNWNSVRNSILRNLEKGMKEAEEKDFKRLEKQLEAVIKDVQGIDSDLGYFLTGLFDKAKIKLASRAYVLGLSMGQAAELTGADKKQLQSYIANTVIHEEKLPQIGIAKRLEKFKKIMK
ncbi:MAG: hypothetical protein JW772_01335 [Candidatus Diapherotrites archaeon]|nr:hypothetical protein [Candidatus Diapherotrites archaeon]